MELSVFNVSERSSEQEPLERDKLSELLVAIEGYVQFLWSVARHRSVEDRGQVLEVRLNNLHS